MSAALPSANARAQRGATMIEVLVSMLILVVGLLGLASLTLNSIRFSDEAGVRSTMTALAYDIIDRIRVNGAARGNYATKFTETPKATTDCSKNSCSAGDFATWELERWKAAVAASLPGGKAEITQTGATQSLVTLQWSDRGVTRVFSLTASH